MAYAHLVRGDIASHGRFGGPAVSEEEFGRAEDLAARHDMAPLVTLCRSRLDTLGRPARAG